MLSSGNGQPRRCALNLMRTFRGEVPYARTKGVDRSLVDIPSSESWRFSADADKTVRIYEPRLTVSAVDVLSDATGSGDVTAVLKTS